MFIGYGGYMGREPDCVADDCRKNIKHFMYGNAIAPSSWICDHKVEYQISAPNFDPFPDRPCEEKEEPIADQNLPGFVGPRK